MGLIEPIGKAGQGLTAAKQEAIVFGWKIEKEPAK
jgi:hypothetical protein